MKKYGNLTIGGLQQKIFNLVLTTIIMLAVANSIVIAAQTLGWTEHSGVWIIALLILIPVCCIANALALSKKIVEPLYKMSDSLNGLQRDNIIFEMKDEYRTGDEVQLLAETIADLSSKTVKYINEIEEITAEREHLAAEMNIAMQIQADMLPRIFPPFPDRKEFDIYASLNPDEMVGGDFYDFFFRDRDHLIMLMADVSGRGVPAALFMVIAKTFLKNRALQGGTPAQILADVNRQLCDNNKAGMYVTVWIAELDVRTGAGLAANAGHEHPILKHADGDFELVEYEHSPVMALDEDFTFAEHPFELQHGDTLFIYTDGATDLQDAEGNMFGAKRLLEVLNRDAEATPKEILRNVTAELESFVEGGKREDDITLLCLHYN